MESWRAGALRPRPDALPARRRPRPRRLRGLPPRGRGRARRASAALRRACPWPARAATGTPTTASSPRAGGAVVLRALPHDRQPRRPRRFDHARDSAYRLDGAHARLACAACHRPETRNGVTFVRYKPLPTTCRAATARAGRPATENAHETPDASPPCARRPGARARCWPCAAQSTKRAAPRGPAARLRASATPRRGGRRWTSRPRSATTRRASPCESAHAQGLVPQLPPDPRLQPAWAPPAPTATRTPTAASWASSCEACHTPTTWTNQREMFQVHNRTRFPLFASHARLDCTACHRSQQPYEYANTPAECGNCHLATYLADHEPQPRPGGLLPALRGLPPRRPRPTWHSAPLLAPRDASPSRAGTPASPAPRCHTAGPTPGPRRDCVSCHQKDYAATTNPNHAAGGFPTTCESCHTSTLAAGQLRPQQTASPHRRPRAVTAQLPRGGATRDAHRLLLLPPADYDRTTNPNHAPRLPDQCQTCHTRRLAPANFDHNRPASPHRRPRAWTAPVPRGRPLHRHADRLLLLPPGGLRRDHEPQPPGLRLPDPVPELPHHDRLAAGHLRPQPDALPAHRRPHARRLRPVPRRRALHGHAHATATRAIRRTTTRPPTPTTRPPASRPSARAATPRPPGGRRASTTTGATSRSTRASTAGKWSSCGDCHVNPGNYRAFECILCHEHSNKAKVDSDHRESRRLRVRQRRLLPVPPQRARGRRGRLPPPAVRRDAMGILETRGAAARPAPWPRPSRRLRSGRADASSSPRGAWPTRHHRRRPGPGLEASGDRLRVVAGESDGRRARGRVRRRAVGSCRAISRDAPDPTSATWSCRVAAAAAPAPPRRPNHGGRFARADARHGTGGSAARQRPAPPPAVVIARRPLAPPRARRRAVADFTVKYRSAANVYLDAGRAQGLASATGCGSWPATRPSPSWRSSTPPSSRPRARSSRRRGPVRAGRRRPCCSRGPARPRPPRRRRSPRPRRPPATAPRPTPRRRARRQRPPARGPACAAAPPSATTRLGPDGVGLRLPGAHGAARPGRLRHRRPAAELHPARAQPAGRAGAHAQRPHAEERAHRPALRGRAALRAAVGPVRLRGRPHRDLPLRRHRLPRRRPRRASGRCRGVQVGAFGGRVADIETPRASTAPAGSTAASCGWRPAGRYATGGYDAMLAFVRENADGDVSREYLSLESRFGSGSRWSLFQRAELDLNTGWRQGRHRQELPALQRLALREPARDPVGLGLRLLRRPAELPLLPEPRRPGGGVRRPAPPGPAGGRQPRRGPAASARRPASG